MTRRVFWLAIALSAAGVATDPVAAQMHKVAPPEDVVRAVGVYEWTGDITKPTASRLIPVTLYIDGHLEDADVYLARPVPLALDTGTVYEVEDAGLSKGLLDLLFARHLQATDASMAFDDGWFGYGEFKGPPKPKAAPLTARSRGAKAAPADSDDDSDRPHFTRRNPPDAPAAKPGGTTPTTQAPSTTSKPDDDPDRPSFSKRPNSSSSSGTDSSSGQSTSPSANPAPPDDPDRPTLKKRSPEQAKEARKEAQQSSVTGASTSLNDDPNRPTLHRGIPTHALTEAEFPKLKGLSIDVHQMVAVSDAKTREPHDFAREWEDHAEKAAILGKMQALARASLTTYEARNPLAATAVPPAAAAPKPASSTVHNTLRRKQTPSQISPVLEPLLEEQLKGYVLSYGGADTFVYTAHTSGDGASLRYVTIVAQKDAMGELKPALQSVTDAAHLDRTPWLRFVDVVDAEASNRASLLFELRGQSARQFALYRVIAARADQTFLSGTTQ